MIKSIVFDIGMVLVDYDWDKYLRSLSYNQQTRDILGKSIFLSPTWIECDRGVLSTEELLSGFIKNAPEYEREIQEVWKNIGQCIKQYSYAIPWIQDLKGKGLSVYVLSNYGKEMYHQSQEELNFLNLVDGGILSYRDKLIKPDERIYLTLLERYGLKAKETIFLDDNEDNVQGAKMVGIHALLFKNYERALHDLEMFGL